MRNRSTSTLKSKLERNLVAYATAATAAGLGVTAMSQPVKAEVVYTPAHVRLGDGGLNPYELDLNNDGIAELRVASYFSCDLGTIHRAPPRSGSCFYFLSANAPNPGNQVVDSEGLRFARALPPDVRIGPHKAFGDHGVMISAFYPSYGTNSVKAGHWINVRNRYLGLRFKLDGQLHYGWARLNVGIRSAGLNRIQITGTLTGFAYETEPNSPIVAGDKGDGASLGDLALGAAAIKQKPVKAGK